MLGGFEGLEVTLKQKLPVRIVNLVPYRHECYVITYPTDRSGSALAGKAFARQRLHYYYNQYRSKLQQYL
jgi:hypothetical protein